MSVFLLLLAGVAAGFAVSELFFDDDTEESAPSPDNDQGEIVRVDTALEALGTEGDDVFTFAAGAEGPIVTSVDAGAGDDIINLASLFGAQALVGSQVSGGAGDDSISVQGDSNTISGGEGDDTIAAELFASSVSGDAGDDLIRVLNGEGDASTVDGGEGNDTIDVTGSANINVTGGAGDDLLVSDGRVIGGTGFAIRMDGGEGDDTLAHSSDIFPLPSPFPTESGATLIGGAGADTFNIALTIGSGSFSSSPDDPALFENNAAVITDFEQGVDVLELDIPQSLIGYTAGTATLTEDAAQGNTTFTVQLTSDTLPTQNFNVVVGATGLSWDDVSFIDQTPQTLLVA